MIGAYLVAILEDLGVACVTAGSSEVALSIAREDDFQVAFVDLGLPDRSGLELICELRALRPTLQVIIETGYSATVAADAQSLEHRAPLVLAKPYSRTDVEIVLNKLTFPPSDRRVHHANA